MCIRWGETRTATTSPDSCHGFAANRRLRVNGEGRLLVAYQTETAAAVVVAVVVVVVVVFVVVAVITVGILCQQAWLSRLFAWEAIFLAALFCG